MTKMNFVSPPTDTATVQYADVLTQAKQEMANAMHRDGMVDQNRNKAPLNQVELDRYVELSKAYLGGIQLPFEMQLIAYDKEGELPTGINIDKSIGLTVVEFLREIIPLRARKKLHGVEKGVDDPEALLEIKQRAVVIYTRCVLEMAEAEAMKEGAMEELNDIETPINKQLELKKIVEANPRSVYFPAPAGAKLGRNGYIHLFPNYPDSPAGVYRGDGAAFDAKECVLFISKHFPDVEDEIMKSLVIDEG